MDREITITVSDEEARLIDERVRSGDFASPADVVRAALDWFAGANADVDADALRQLVEEAKSDPSPDIPADEAFEQVRRYIRSRGESGAA